MLVNLGPCDTRVRGIRRSVSTRLEKVMDSMLGLYALPKLRHS